MEQAHVPLLGFEDLVVSTTNKWSHDVSNFDNELLELVNIYLAENFGDSIRPYDLVSLRSAFNLIELKEQSKHLGEGLTNEVTKRLIYRLVRHLIQSHRLFVLNEQKSHVGLWKLGMGYEYEGSDSKVDLDKTAVVLVFSVLGFGFLMWTIDRLNK